MIVSNEIAKLLATELETGDSVSDWYAPKESWDEGMPDVKKVHSALIDTSRWSEIHEAVYLEVKTGKYWHTTYSVGATESQDERPYEYDGREIEFTEVKPIEVKVIKYVEV